MERKLEEISESLKALHQTLAGLGFNGASTSKGPGAIEDLALVIRNGFEQVAESLDALVDAINDGRMR